MRKFQQTKMWKSCIGLVLIASSIHKSEASTRSKRFLTFPRTSPTRLQMISGIGIPVDLEFESVTVGWVQKSEFFLPENASNYLNFLYDPFDLTTRPIGNNYRKKRSDLLEEPKPTENPAQVTFGFDSAQNEKYEKHQVEAEIVDSGHEEYKNENELTEADYWNQEDRAEWLREVHPNKPKNLAMARWAIYKSMTILAQSKGLDGRSCVLRAICEAAHTSFDYSNGILGELMHIVMTPSLTKDKVADHSDYEYYHAENLGKEGAPCEHAFKECKISILDQFSGIYTPMMDLIQRMST